jgi:hypothetical protein
MKATEKTARAASRSDTRHEALVQPGEVLVQRRGVARPRSTRSSSSVLEALVHCPEVLVHAHEVLVQCP